MKPGIAYNVQDMLDGTQSLPVMPGMNPYPLWTIAWFAWKEEHEDYLPYHRCDEMPRVYKVAPDLFKCPACGVEFPTYTVQMTAMLESGKEQNIHDKS